jgi:preprotein translocase subunit YajC
MSFSVSATSAADSLAHAPGFNPFLVATIMFANLIFFAEEGGGGGGLLSTMLPLLLIFGAFYFLLILPKKRQEKKERDELFTNLKKNDEVLTYAGIIGIVVQVHKDKDEVVLKIDENSNVRLRVLKSTIARIMTPKETAKEQAPAAAAQAAQTAADNVKAAAPPAK